VRDAGATLRIGLADDSTLFRDGLSSLLTTAGCEVAVSARTGEELQAELESTPVHAVILDIRMPPTFTDEGLRAAAAVRHDHPDTSILLLSTYAQADYAARLLQLPGGGVGYLLKDRVDDVTTLTDTLRRLAAGESVVDPDIVSRLLSRRRTADALSGLTQRERDVLRLMAEGRSNAGISAELFLSPKTVEAHAASVFAKLGLAGHTRLNRRVLAVLTWLRADPASAARDSSKADLPW
jgi:DNA-binding NarL/FixJ family response regulator